MKKIINEVLSTSSLWVAPLILVFVAGVVFIAGTKETRILVREIVLSMGAMFLLFGMLFFIASLVLSFFLPKP